MINASRLARFLDKELNVGAYSDSSHNGLQVASTAQTIRIGCGVDASMEFFRRAKEEGANFLVCHHGISWGDSLRRISGLNYEKISFLIRNDMALYACHLPLDAHPRYGNNAQLAKAIGLQRIKRFGLYSGIQLGFCGELQRAMSLADFKALVARVTGGLLQTMEFGPPRIRTVGIVSGGAAEEIEEAGQKGLDAYLSGEPKLMAYSLAQEYRIHGLFAGHYATETFGVRALGKLLDRKFGVPASFIDLKVKF
jgi:dinuclear metal center YbgI/SA1388 family protein